MVIHQSHGAISKAEGVNRKNEMHFRPIYDWTTQDVWKYIHDKNLDFNEAYNAMARFGIPMRSQRIAPVTMVVHGVGLIQMAAKAWPDWFQRLCVRLPGVKLAALYGRQAMMPVRRPNETWEQAYQRLCIDEAPKWISERAVKYREHFLMVHTLHAPNQPMLEVKACPVCSIGRGSWRKMCQNMYFGDPFLLETNARELGYLQPDEFRPGARLFTIGKKATFG
jgi:predicted phosphoadenosine phosphosulfate sulfurtransferase